MQTMGIIYLCDKFNIGTVTRYPPSFFKEFTVPRVRQSSSPATLRQVAAEANVSIATVSRYLNNRLKVEPATETRILAAIKKLGYRTNLLAQGLARGQTMMIGVLTPWVTSPFYDHMQYGLETTVRQSGYVCVSACGEWDDAAQIKVLDLFVGRRVDGIVVLGSRLPDDTLASYATQVPIALFGQSIEAENLYSVNINHVNASFAATEHLVSLGHRDILHIAGKKDNPDTVERLMGYRRALEAAGIPFRPEMVIPGNFAEESGMAALEEATARGLKYSAVFAANDQMAYGFRLALFQRGINVPDQVSIVGYDDLPGSMYCTPPLTTIRQPTYEIGAVMGKGLVALIKNRIPESPDVKLDLIVRQSTKAFSG